LKLLHQPTAFLVVEEQWCMQAVRQPEEEEQQQQQQQQQTLLVLHNACG
jgi:hypothetical protein